jgi:HPt (histidine-containing phosphotransfer) domain-containing protein
LNKDDQGSFYSEMAPVAPHINVESKRKEASYSTEEEVYDYSKMPEEFKGLKVAKALKMVGDKKSLYIKLMILFKKNYCTLSDDLLKALQEKDVMTAGRLVHTIKGSASNLGAEQLRMNAYELEEIITTGKENLQDALSDFCVQLDMTIAIMDEFVDKFKHLG